ncbi:two-component sensor histidine kinase [candidate division LCP-89 bacterium B3_LCP]|uniref:histidine kinase n=1 Tax=candidate division LCP-89 bacterium B3_LCP TaxID=2012998 RepID=A0A532UXV0_UNCL8|nr:MAG: two-component sensor histidine kinase [candidate division LCP-89 bacterium B3_LCP]
MALYDKVTPYFKPKASRALNIAPADRYRKLWRFAIMITSIISIIPLVIMTVVNYYDDQRAYRAEMEHRISQILSNTQRTLEMIIEGRRSALTMVINEKGYDELSCGDCLNQTLINLKRSYGGFVDLGLIDSDGTQKRYSGPYNLEGKNYKEQQWFQEVSLRDVYVSDVFMGYRNFPHFVITVKSDMDGGDFFVLRATLDMDLISQQIYSIDLDARTDAFIINQLGVLQTASKFYGNVLDEPGIIVPFHSRNKIVINEQAEGGKKITQGYIYIKGTPFILMASTRLENPLRHWISRRSELIWLLFIMMVIIVIVIVSRTTYMVNRLRSSDERQAKAFHNMEYTSKMATIGRMSASVAHEINNPLAIINEKAGLLKDIVSFTDEFPNKDKSLGLLTAVEDSVERCSKVTHRLLGFSRRMDIRKELIDMEHLMKEVVGFVGKEAEHRNITINYDIEANVSAIESDRGQLQQVFLNIVNNGIAAVADGGTIDIAVSRAENGYVAVTVKDNGTGISEENLKHIFEPFYSTKGEFGTGLGLSITNDIVEKLGGYIAVDSKLRKGTSFTITLPPVSKGTLE